MCREKDLRCLQLSLFIFLSSHLRGAARQVERTAAVAAVLLGVSGRMLARCVRQWRGWVVSEAKGPCL